MVAAMIGHHHRGKPPALSHSHRHSKHNTIAERNHRRLHVLCIIMPFRNSIGTAEQRAFEITPHKAQWNDNMLNAKPLAMKGGKRQFARIMIGTIVETQGQCDSVAILIEHRDRIHAATDNEKSILLHRAAIISISTRAPFGRSRTAKAERPGNGEANISA